MSLYKVTDKYILSFYKLDTLPSHLHRYVAENLRKVNIDLSDVPQDLMEYCEGLTVLWKRVVAFYTLRLSLAPALETLLLLDRALFLLENS